MTPIAIAITASAFNLVCSGTSYFVATLMGPQQDVKSFQVTYRVDLGSQRWCKGDCVSTSPLAKVTETQIVFEMEERATLNDTVTTANRESGYYFDRTRLDGFMSLAEGKCVKAPFSGFPTRKF